MTARRLALVTGASSGIGAEFARQLAARGYNLILTARREDRLSALAAQLAHDFGAACETLPADLSDDAGIEVVRARLAAGDVHILVNNAGFGIAGSFARADLAEQERMVAVHMLAPTRLMHAALPGMIRRGSGGVINVSSLASFVSLPGNANYSATKSYLTRFSRAVHSEVRHKGVTVQALCPGFVVTEFHDDRDRVRTERSRYPAFLWMKAERVVADSLRAFERGRPLVVPGAVYTMVYWIAKLGLADAVLPYVMPRS